MTSRDSRTSAAASDTGASVAVSVAVATCDRPAELGRCLDAIRAGERLPADTIVVDQGSGGAGRDTVEARRHGGLPVTYVPQSGLGLSRSRNAGIRQAKTAAVAFIDDDCAPAPGWVAAIERALAEGADAVTGPMLPLGPAQPGLHPVASRTSMVRCVHAGSCAQPWTVGTGGNITVRREWLERLGGCDERLGAGTPGRAGEDIDLIHRLLRAGASIRYEPDAVVYHARQASDRRRRSRPSYGWGVGACCTLWLRRRDRSAALILLRWLCLRTELLLRAVGRGRWTAAYEELLVLAGTAGGLVYGVRAGRPE